MWLKHILMRQYKVIPFNRYSTKGRRFFDVAKMLRVVVKRLHLNATLSSEIKERVKQKMSSQMRVRLVEIK